MTPEFHGYRRADGRVGLRNQVLVLSVNGPDRSRRQTDRPIGSRHSLCGTALRVGTAR